MYVMTKLKTRQMLTLAVLAGLGMEAAVSAAPARPTTPNTKVPTSQPTPQPSTPDKKVTAAAAPRTLSVLQRRGAALQAANQARASQGAASTPVIVPAEG